jgi:hypothetical protein
MSLTAEFPAARTPNLVAGHRWHLACEFSNIIKRRREPIVLKMVYFETAFSSARAWSIWSYA